MKMFVIGLVTCIMTVIGVIAGYLVSPESVHTAQYNAAIYLLKNDPAFMKQIDDAIRNCEKK